MATDNGPTWLAIVDNQVDQLISSWHTHRVGLCAITLAAIGLVLAWRVGTGNWPSQTSELSPAPEGKAPRLRKPESRREQKELSANDDGPCLSPTESKPDLAHSQVSKPKVIAGKKPARAARRADVKTDKAARKAQPLIFFSSLTGTTERLASSVAENLKLLSSEQEYLLPPKLLDLSYVDLDDYFITGPKSLDSLSFHGLGYFYCVLIPSYDIDTIITTFLAHLDETHNDFRIDTAPLSTLLGYSVFGIGDKQGWPTEEQGFCSQAIEVDKWMAKLTGRKRAYPLGLGDVKSDIEASLTDWTTGVANALKDICASGSLGDGVPGSGAALESDEEEGDEEEGDDADMDVPDSTRKKRRKTLLADLEDVGGSNVASQRGAPLAIDFTTTSIYNAQSISVKEMVPETSCWPLLRFPFLPHHIANSVD